MTDIKNPAGWIDRAQAHYLAGRFQEAQSAATIAQAMILQGPPPEEMAAQIIDQMEAEGRLAGNAAVAKLQEVETILRDGVRKGPRHPALSRALQVIEYEGD